MNEETSLDKFFTLWCYVKNLGDGSISIVPCKNEKEAKLQDDKQEDNFADGSVESFDLKIIDGKIYYYSEEYNPEKREFVRSWIELSSRIIHPGSIYERAEIK